MHPSTGTYVLLNGVRHLCLNGCLRDSSCQWVLPNASIISVLVPAVSHSHHLPPEGTLQVHQVSLVQAPMKSLLFSWIRAYKNLCVSLKSKVSVSPSPVALRWSSPICLQSPMLLGILLPISDPHTEDPNVCLSMLSPMGGPLQCNFFLVCGSPTQKLQDLTVSRMYSLQPSCCGFLFFFFFKSF